MKIEKVVPLVVLFSLVGTLASAQLTSQNQAVNPEVLLLKQSADLVVSDLGINSLGEIVFTLQNRGYVGINEIRKQAPGIGTASGVATGGSSSKPPIRVDLYIGTTLFRSVYTQGLAGKGSKSFTVKLVSNVSNVPKCMESRDLKTIIDPQNVIKELHDDNNVLALTAERPCPDLAVKSIKRDYEGLLNETYGVKVTVINQGNAPSPSTQVWGTALTAAPGIDGWPEFSPTHTIPALAPGEKTSFKIGGSNLSTSSCWVRIILDRYFHIEESNEGNNFKEDKL